MENFDAILYVYEKVNKKKNEWLRWENIKSYLNTNNTHS